MVLSWALAAKHWDHNAGTLIISLYGHEFCENNVQDLLAYITSYNYV